MNLNRVHGTRDDVPEYMQDLMALQVPIAERLLKGAVYVGVLLVFFSFTWLIVDVISQGIGMLNADFLFSEPRKAGRSGGISSILVSTCWVVGLALVVATPLALACAVWLTEYSRTESFSSKCVQVAVDVLAGIPSIVYGLFGSVLFVQVLGLGYSILAGALTLACMVLPIMVRALESGLAGVPPTWRHGAATLGLSKASALWHILLPAAAPSITAGFMLGAGRAIAETAALIFTSGYVDRMPSSMFDSGRVLAVHIFDLSMNVPGGDRAAYGSALVLLIIILAINGVALFMADRLFSRRIAS